MAAKRLAALAAIIGCLWLALPSTANASITHPAAKANAAVVYRIPRWHAYLWALENEIGHQYCWGGAGPSCYDCSGAVMAAYDSVGFYLPHNTVAMLDSGMLTRVYGWNNVKAGDLVFWGTGHVELYAGHYGVTLGALNFGTLVDFHLWRCPWWCPTAAYHVNGSG